MTESARQGRRVDGLSDRTLGDFVVRELIGQGGFGAIYRAEQPLLEREAVIKVVARPNDASEESIARFLREARLASQLDHPYAAHIYAFGAEADGLQWIAMELVRGTTLAELCSIGGPIPLERFVPLFERLCEVVYTAHEQGIVHRDIKPENVMVLSRAGRYLPKLLDLGIAKAVAGTDSPVEQMQSTGGRSMAVTGAHGMLGSPRYMAPELWFAPTTAGATVDQYALGALAYEALTGSVAFPGESLEEVAMGHAKRPPPRLPDEFPAELADALVKAMGKRVGDRFESALELATAVRDGSGLEIKRIAVPELDPELAATIAERFPTPIVEALSAYAAAVNAHQARDGLKGLITTVSRYLGVLALQCRSRVGGGAADSRTSELLVALRRGALRDADWLELAHLVCQPFARRPDAFPIPELVVWLEGHAKASPLRSLLDADSGIFEGSMGTDEAILESVSVSIGAVEGLLRSISFVAEYPLVVIDGGRGEVLMGTRPRIAKTVPRELLDVADGRAVLESASGAPILSLWPLLQVREPTPGQRAEVFLFEGASRRGARLTSRPVGFEVSDPDLWEWFSRELLEVGADSGDADEGMDQPYLGMATFGAADAKNFFGREREIEAVSNRLRTQSFIAIVGPSGAGKSSFVHAGVATALEDYEVISLRPGADPIGNLAARLSRTSVGKAQSTEEIRELFESSARALGNMLRNQKALLVIDQFEEVFTMCRDESARVAFIESLCAAVADSAEPLRIVLTLRDDFLMVAEKNAALRPKLARGLQLLGTPAPADLRRILLEPARAAGYRFEDAAIADEMVEAVADLAGALPLLSFTAAKLWSLRDRHFKQLPTKAYRSLGGVVGALAQHAEDTLAEMSASERQLVRSAFRHLVTAEGTRASLTRDELREVLGDGSDAEPVIEKLVAARILVAGESERGEVTIEIVHEALLSAWPRLVQWRREDAEGARLRDQLRAAARQWDERGRPSGLLWRGDALAELSIWRGRFDGELPRALTAFADASERDAQRGRRIRQGLMLLAFIALAVGVVVLFRANRAAQKSADDSERRLIALLQEQGRQAHLDGRPLDSMLYLDRAKQLGADGVGLDYMVARAISARESELMTIDSSTGSQFWGVAYDRKGTSLAASDAEGVTLLLDPSTGAVRHKLEQDGFVNTLEFSADGNRLMSLSRQSGVAVWDVASGKALASIGVAGSAALAPPIESASLTPDGAHVVIADSKTVSVWTVSPLARVWQRKDGAPPMRVAAAPNGSRFALTDRAGGLEVRTLSGELLGTGIGHTARASGLAWSADSAMLATASHDKTVRVWSGTDAKALTTIRQRGVAVAVTFSPDGSRLVTGGRFETGGLYSPTTGEELAPLRGHTGFVNLGRFTADGSEVVTASQDGSVRLWDAQRGTLIATFAGHTGFVWALALDPSAPRMASASWDGTVRVWNRDARQLVRFVGDRGPSAYDSATDVLLSSRRENGESRVVIRAGQSGAVVHELGPFATPVTDVAIAVGAALVALDDSVVRFELTTGARSQRLALEGAGKTLASSGDHIAILDVSGRVSLASTSLQVVASRELPAQPFGDLRFSPDRSLLAVAGDGVTILRVPSLEIVRVIDSGDLENDGPVSSLDFSADGQRLLLGRFGSKARLWTIEGTKVSEIATATPVMMAALSGSGERVAIVTMDGSAAIWRAGDGALVRRLDGHRGGIYAVAFSADDKLIATASVDRTARLWDAEQLRLLDVFSAHRGFVRHPWFSADRSRILLAGEDGIAIMKIDAEPHQSLKHYVACNIDKRLGADGIVPRLRSPTDCP